jgi:hypothetical protein
MKLKRPGKMRIELQFNGKTALQVYDGSNGWKLRPFLKSEDGSMLQKSLVVCLSLVFTISSAAGGNTPSSGGQLSAAEIVEKNVTARGGLQAWRGVRTMSMEGKLGAGGNRRDAVQVPSPASSFWQRGVSKVNPLAELLDSRSAAYENSCNRPESCFFSEIEKQLPRFA